MKTDGTLQAAFGRLPCTAAYYRVLGGRLDERFDERSRSLMAFPSWDNDAASKTTSEWIREKAMAAGGWIFGFGLGFYAKAFVALVAVGVLFFGLRRLLSSEKRFLASSLAIQGGHLAWLGSAILIGLWEPVILDVLIFTPLLVWLAFRPGLIVISILLLLQVASTAMNLDSIADTTIGDPAHRALVGHLLLRAGAITTLIGAAAVLRSRRKKANEMSDLQPHPNAAQHDDED